MIILFQIVLAIVLLGLTGGFVAAQFNDNVSFDSCIGLGLLWTISVLLLGVSFLK